MTLGKRQGLVMPKRTSPASPGASTTAQSRSRTKRTATEVAQQGQETTRTAPATRTGTDAKRIKRRKERRRPQSGDVFPVHRCIEVSFVFMIFASSYILSIIGLGADLD